MLPMNGSLDLKENLSFSSADFVSITPGRFALETVVDDGDDNIDLIVVIIDWYYSFINHINCTYSVIIIID